MNKLQADYDKVQKANDENEDELQGRIKALQMELDDMRLENRSKEGEMTRELDTRRGTIQELRLSIERREQEIGESSTEVLKEPRRKVSVFKKSMSSSDVMKMIQESNGKKAGVLELSQQDIIMVVGFAFIGYLIAKKGL